MRNTSSLPFVFQSPGGAIRPEAGHLTNEGYRSQLITVSSSIEAGKNKNPPDK